MDIKEMESRNGLLPFIDCEFGLYAHVGRYLPGNFDLEANQVTRLCLDRPGSKLCDTDPDRASVQNLIEHISVSRWRRYQDK